MVITDKETLYKLYWVERKSVTEIAKELNVSPSAVYKWMKKFNIPRRPRSESTWIAFEKKRKRRGITREILEKLYWEEGKSIIEIAKVLNIHYSTVSILLKKYDIPVRIHPKMLEYHHKKKQGKLNVSRDFLYRKYWEEGKTLKEIANELGTGVKFVRNTMKKFNISLRTPKERMQIFFMKKRGFEIIKNLLEVFLKRGLTTSQIAKRLEIDPKTVREYLKKFGLPVKSRIKYFDVNNKEILSYILGVCFGDGCVCRSSHHNLIILGQSIKNKNFVLSFAKALKEIGLNPIIYTESREINKNRYEMIFVFANSKMFYNFFKKLTIKDVRDIVMKSIRNMVMFVRGFYESEGSNTTNKKHRKWIISMSNTNIEVLNLVKEILEKLGLNFKLYGPYKQDPYKPKYSLQSGNRITNYKFLKTIRPCIKNQVPLNLFLRRKRGPYFKMSLAQFLDLLN